MKPIITVTIMSNGTTFSMDAIDFSLTPAPNAEFVLVAPDELTSNGDDGDRAYERLVKEIGDHCAITRWTDPDAKIGEKRVVSVGTMVIRWCADVFAIHSVTPYIH